MVSAAFYAGFMPDRVPARSGVVTAAEGLAYSNADGALALAPGTGGPAAAPANAPNSARAQAAPPASSRPDVIAAAASEIAGVLAPLQALAFLECDHTHSDKFCVYEVQDGDMLGKIADKFGLTSTEDIVNWELLVHSNKPDIVDEETLLQIGQKLRIPTKNGAPFNGVIHTVLRAETLSELSTQYGVSLGDILAENGIIDADLLAIGDELTIPGPTRFPSYVFVDTSVSSSDGSDGGSVSSGPAIVGGGSRSNYGFIWPVAGPISSYFGPRHPLGIDIDLFGNIGAPIAAARAGTVTFAGGNPCCSYGYYVVVDHGDGFRTLYAHLSSIAVSQGQRVAQGQLVGYGGSTGYSTGDHLHFEVHLNGVIVNPLNYLP